MVVVKLEMWPEGDESKAYTLGRTYIWNETDEAEHAANPNRGDYGVAVMRKGREEESQYLVGNIVRSGSVKNYPRLSYNVWRLIIRALKAAFPEEK